MKPMSFNFRYRKVLVIILCMIASSRSFSQQFATTIAGWNAYVHLPSEYTDSVNKNYPLIVFMPGIGEVGSDVTKLLVHGPSKFIAAGDRMEFMVNGKLEKPIVISLQPALTWCTPWDVNIRIDSILRRWRIDLQRVNLTGLSMGGQSCQSFVDGVSPTLTNKIASIVPMSAPAPNNGIGNMKLFSQAGGTWWGFEGTSDNREMDKIRDTMNAAFPNSARYTLYTGGHCCWNTWYNPAYNENGESIYTWMLKQRRAISNNLVPQAFAGRDTSIATVVPSLPLKGSGNDPNGDPIYFTWAKLTGPAGGNISNATVAQPVISSLTTGVYKYTLQVRDAFGAIAKDTITIAVGAVLPVRLTEFSAIRRNNNNHLQWKTTMESNCSHFVIERSADGRSFSEIGTVSARGNSSSPVDYFFTDNESSKATFYYRLRIVDLDGRFEHSRTVYLIVKNPGVKSISILQAIYAGGNTQINVSSEKDQPFQVVVTDASGRVVMNKSVKGVTGVNFVTGPAVISRGIYYVKVIAVNESETLASFN